MKKWAKGKRSSQEEYGTRTFVLFLSVSVVAIISDRESQWKYFTKSVTVLILGLDVEMFVSHEQEQVRTKHKPNQPF